MYNRVAVENGVSELGCEIRFLLPRTLAIVVAVLAFAYADVLAAQRITPPQRLPETTGPLIVGQITVRVQQDTGAPFVNPATIMLRSPDMSVDLRSSTDRTGQTEFTNVPSGQYLLEA